MSRVVRCPNCTNTDVRASHWRLRDLAFLLLFLRPLRCYGCNGRFHVALWRRVRPKDAQS